MHDPGGGVSVRSESASSSAAAEIGSAGGKPSRFLHVDALIEHGAVEGGRAFRVGRSCERHQSDAVGLAAVDELAGETVWLRQVG